ncbi:MAG: hypothetical protein D9V47_02675 [Clostridia bacterium]|nr:MAG: hypothetical protein D9V47_02675 [Clostridia bacterium]
MSLSGGNRGNLAGRKDGQAGCFFLALAVAVFLAVVLAHFRLEWAAVWIFGLLVGFVLHRSQVCFAASFRDCFLFHDYAMVQALVTLLLTVSLGFAVLDLTGLLPDFPYYWRSGPATVLGGFLFGLGMVLAGACACTSLVRLGEGFLLYLLVGAGLAGGTLLGAYTYPLWLRLGGLSSLKPLPVAMGWPAALALQVGGLAGAWWLLRLARRRG